MSLEGKLKNPASDELIYPTMIDMEVKGVAAPTCISELRSSLGAQDSSWFDQVDVTKGGAAGKGPEPPEPFTALVDGSKEYPNMAEEVDSVEQEVKTKMAFAKMPIPQVFKESFLLDESEFITKVEDIDNASGEAKQKEEKALNSTSSSYSGESDQVDEFSRTVENGIDLSATSDGYNVGKGAESGDSSPTPSTDGTSRPNSRAKPLAGKGSSKSGKTKSSKKKGGGL